MSSSKKKRLYIGCGINNLPEDKKEGFLGMVSDLKKKLSEDFTILDFLGTVAASPEEVYLRDIVEHVGTADLMLAICDYPSTGMGYEMAVAIEMRKIPVLAIAHQSSNVSKLVLGIHGIYEPKKFLFQRYNSVEEIALMVKELFEIRDFITE